MKTLQASELVKPLTEIDLDPMVEPELNVEVPEARDRGFPTWGKYFSMLFSAGIGVSVVAIAVGALLLQRLVGEQGNVFLTGILTLAATIPILAILVLDYCQARSLAGFRDARKSFVASTKCFVAVILVIGLGIVHPVIGFAAVLASVVGVLSLILLRRFGRIEPHWDFDAAEAISLLSGRDQNGLTLAGRKAANHSMASSFENAAAALALVLSCGLGAWLVASEVLASAAVPATMIINFWATKQICAFAKSQVSTDEIWQPHRNVSHVSIEKIDPNIGLSVQNLTVRDGHAHSILDNIAIEIRPGEVVGVVGASGSGKSLLLQAIVDPFMLNGLNVSGYAACGDRLLWERSSKAQSVPVWHVADQPRILHSSGLNNLTCFQSDILHRRAVAALETFVFSADRVDEITRIENAQFLAGSDQRALEFARAFLFRPEVYVFDRPESMATDDLMRALCNRVKSECRSGRAVLVATEHRQLSEMCDKLIVLQSGRVVDFGPAREIRDRMSNGWQRLVCERQLESEEVLENWTRNHFKRLGDEANRRKLCTVAAELLAFSCDGTDPLAKDKVHFEFKHFEGHCILRLTDKGSLLSSGQMQIAQRFANKGEQVAMPPLAKVMHGAISVEQSLVDDQRVITAKIATYDPRKAAMNKKSKSHAGPSV